jgi:hypothetical protein
VATDIVFQADPKNACSLSATRLTIMELVRQLVLRRTPLTCSGAMEMIFTYARLFRWFGSMLGAAAFGLLAGAMPARADLLITCPGCAVSTIGGTAVIVSPSTLPPILTFARNPNDNTGLPQGANLTPLFLIPDNAPSGASLHFNETFTLGGTITGIAVSLCDLPCESPGGGFAAEWSTPGSNFLPSYLGITQLSGPQIPFDELLAATRTVDPGANGYFVYIPLRAVPMQLGTGMDARLSIGGIGSFPAGTMIEGFLSDFGPGADFIVGAVGRDATANALFVGRASVPEPSPWLLLLLGSCMAGCALRFRSKLRRRVAS